MVQRKIIHKLYCGGTFCFDYRNTGFEIDALNDYRAELLGSVDNLLKSCGDDGVKLTQNVS